MAKKETPGEGGSPYQPYKPKPSGPYVPAPKRDSLQIATGDSVDPTLMNYVTKMGFFLDGSGKAYMQTGGKLYDAGEYNPDIHGLPVPLAKNRKKLGIGIA